MTPSPAAFLADYFAPAGTRLQLLLAHPVDPAVDAAARALVVEHGLVPERRVATLRPRPGDDELRTADVVQFFERYGHEYSVGWMGAAGSLDQEAVSAAAAAVGCRLGWSERTAPRAAMRDATGQSSGHLT